MELIAYNEELHRKCFENKELSLGYVRGDIDKKGRMWTRYIKNTQGNFDRQGHDALMKFMDEFVELPCMDSIESLYKFASAIDGAKDKDGDGITFTLYADDEYNCYLIRIICTDKDYNFYVNAFCRKESE